MYKKAKKFVLRPIVKWEIACVNDRVGALMTLACGHIVAARVDPRRIIELNYTKARCYECAKQSR